MNPDLVKFTKEPDLGSEAPIPMHFSAGTGAFYSLGQRRKKEIT
jgi:hypothetical protein